ncbi:hypothetical protein [Petroclostridium sp. X23]|nr:hypothetical protein [Petroclostridium sp. X23]WHH56937.1 hypothetical protein QKW49_13875 [Petroclostridium sp. X23]
MKRMKAMTLLVTVMVLFSMLFTSCGNKNADVAQAGKEEAKKG